MGYLSLRRSAINTDNAQSRRQTIFVIRLHWAETKKARRARNVLEISIYFAVKYAISDAT
jgi:hypothetical protein